MKMNEGSMSSGNPKDMHPSVSHDVHIEPEANPYEATRKDDRMKASIHGMEKTIPIADAQGNFAVVQKKGVRFNDSGPDDGTSMEEEEPKKKNMEQKKDEKLVRRSVVHTGADLFRYLYSLGLIIFSVVVVMAALFTNQTAAAEKNIPPVGAFFIFWFLILWLAMIEGGQGALVSLVEVEKPKYIDSHKRAHKCTSLAHKGDNMERFIVGRQFLVVLLVFLINMMGSASEGASVLGLNSLVNQIFLSSGLAMVLITITLGQLAAQVTAAKCTLDFINNYFMLFSTYVSLGIELSGLLHSVYLIQLLFAKLSGNPIESKEPPRSFLQNVFFWVRVLVSLAILGFAFAVTLDALFEEKTTMWDGVPPGASVAIFFILMCFVGLMEGMQIALFAAVNLAEDEIAKHPVAAKNCRLTFSGINLQAFLIGRQICVTVCMFVVAKISTLDIVVGTDDNSFNVSDGLQTFFNTGLLGAVITTIVASLIWRVIASSFPLAFLSNPLIYPIIRLCLMLEKFGICASAWILSRYHKIMMGFQPDEVHLEGAKPITSAPVDRREKDIDRLVNAIRYIYSLGLLIFSVAIVMAAMFTNQTAATQESIPAIASFFIFWFLILWLAMIEGGQGALVGLQSVPSYEIANVHHVSSRCTNLAHKGDNMERFIVGRQFLVVLLVFVINMMGSAAEGATVLNLPESVRSIFLGSGLAMILITIMIGQLTAQVNAANCMLDFINSYFMLFSTYVSLAIEFSGLLHSVYLVQIIFSKITGQEIDSNEPPRSTLQNVFFWARVVMSLAILGFSLAVTLDALFQGKTTMWGNVPPAASVIIFFILMCLVGLMEGMQIALFAVVNLDEEELAKHRVALANCQLAFRDENLQAFLIGRQICVTVCMFVVAKISTLDITVGTDENIFNISNGVQAFFNTGLLGAVITTIIASLAWRIIASSFPLAFLSNPLIYLIIRLCLIIEKSGICAAAWVLARYHKPLMGYQTDEVYLMFKERQTWAPVTKRDKDIDITITIIKYIYSLGLLVFSIVMVMTAIFTEQTKIAMNAHPVVALVIFWFLILWLAMIEGGQGALVGLQPVEKSKYARTHKIAHKCTLLSHRGDNMERFIVGRQFLVVLIVFVTSMCGATGPGAKVFDLPSVISIVFLGSGLALMLTTIMLGQLTAQVVAASCMLDFINNYFMLFSTYISLGIELSGLLHSVYLVQIFFSKVTGQPIESKEPPRSGVENVFFWGRVIFSVGVLGFAFAVTLDALFQSKTAMWDGVPAGASVAIFFVLVCFVGLMEGMQIALFAVINLPEEELNKSKIAAANCKLTFASNNFAAFLIGRQICVTVCMFIVAKITTLNVVPGKGENIFGVSDGLQNFFNSGLLGAIITTIVASLAWRIVASSFPLLFMSNPLIYLIIRICLLLEKTGICSASWFLSLMHKEVFAYKPDENYVGEVSTEEEVPEAPSGPNRKSSRMSRRSSAMMLRHSSVIIAQSDMVNLQLFVDKHQNLPDEKPRLIHPMALDKAKASLGRATRHLENHDNEEAAIDNEEDLV